MFHHVETRKGYAMIVIESSIAKRGRDEFLPIDDD